MTALRPIWFAVIPGSPGLGLMSHIEVWYLAWQIWHLPLLLHSAALCFAPAQLKHKCFSAKIFFLSSGLMILSQFIALCASLEQYKQALNPTLGESFRLAKNDRPLRFFSEFSLIRLFFVHFSRASTNCGKVHSLQLSLVIASSLLITSNLSNVNLTAASSLFKLPRVCNII